MQPQTQVAVQHELLIRSETWRWVPATEATSVVVARREEGEACELAAGKQGAAGEAELAEVERQLRRHERQRLLEELLPLLLCMLRLQQIPRLRNYSSR